MCDLVTYLISYLVIYGQSDSSVKYVLQEILIEEAEWPIIKKLAKECVCGKSGL